MSYYKTRLRPRRIFMRDQAFQEFTCTVGGCENVCLIIPKDNYYAFTKIDLGKLIALCKMHQELSNTFDNYKLLNVNVEITPLSSKWMRLGTHMKNVYGVFTTVDRNGTINQSTSLGDIFSYASTQTSSYSSGGDFIPGFVRKVVMNGSFCNSKKSPSCPALIFGVFNPRFYTYTDDVRIYLSVQYKAQVTYRGVRRDVSQIAGPFDNAQLINPPQVIV